MEEEYFTVNEIAERAKVTRAAVYDWMKSGTLRFVYIGKHRRIPKSAWLSFIRPGSPSDVESLGENGQKNLAPAPAF
ncbi:MAG: helix-turn-helix domain-containing protein [Oscillochloris sp.]|nr:helix-turn-helix domain-containing protein [Oscillochloris sp.]